MGHDTYDTQQSLYYVNVYIIYYLIFFTYLKIARESNTNYKIGFYLLKLIENLNLFLKSRNPLLSCHKVSFLIDVSFLTVFQVFNFLACSPNSEWIPNKLLITCLIVSHTLFALCSTIVIYISQIHVYKNIQQLIYFGII
jgi:hypothetical protein